MAEILCDVDGSHAARFDVTMKIGVVYRGCAIHGDGGLLYGRKALSIARRRIDETSVVSEMGERKLRIYVVHRWSHDECVYVMPAEVAAVELHEVVS